MALCKEFLDFVLEQLSELPNMHALKKQTK